MGIKNKIQSLFNQFGYQVTKSAHSPKSLRNKSLNQEVTFLDIGASYGLSEKWEQYAHNDKLKLILVEPDPIQSQEIKLRYPKALLVPHALGNKNEKGFVNITYAQGCSSVLDPNDEVLNRFPVKKWFEVTRKIEIDIFRFDFLARQAQISNVDFVKIDVQGYEYEVLEGFGNYLNDVLCIELETHLVPIYKSQKTLTDINKLLNDKGFFLRHLNAVGPFEGEVIEFDAFFVKRKTPVQTELQQNKIVFWEDLNNIPPAKTFQQVDTF